MSNELLPCPFCGGKTSFHKDEGCDGCHYIECQSCKGMFDLSTKADPENSTETLEDLNERIATVWNQRSQQSAPAGYRMVPVEMLNDWKISYHLGRISQSQCIEQMMELLAAAPKADVQEPVATVTIQHFRQDPRMENVDFQLQVTLPQGTHKLYAAPQPVHDGSQLIKLLDRVRLNDDESKRHGRGATYWNNAVFACQVAIRDELAAPQPVSDDARDAARYRWICAADYNAPSHPFIVINDFDSDKASIDAAIDAVMGSKGDE